MINLHLRDQNYHPFIKIPNLIIKNRKKSFFYYDGDDYGCDVAFYYSFIFFITFKMLWNLDSAELKFYFL